MIKLLFILALSLFGLCTSNPIDVASSYGSANGLYCDTLLCPAIADTCVVKSNSIKNSSKILTVRQCKHGNKIILTDESESDNPTKMSVNSYAESSFGTSAVNVEKAKKISDAIENDIRNVNYQVASSMQHHAFGGFNNGFFYPIPVGHSFYPY